MKNERLPHPTFLSGWASRLCFIVTFAAIGYALLPRLQFMSENIARWLPYPYFRAGSEGLILSEAAIVRAGGSLYVPLRPDLFISGPYPPLYYYLLAASWPAGSSVAAGFTAGRIISLISALTAAFLIALLVVAECNRIRPAKISFWAGAGWVSLAGIVAGATFLSMPAVAVWATRVRADMLMVALQMLALVLLAWKPRSWPAFAALLPLTLALYTKHTGLAAPAAAIVFMLLQNWNNWRRVLSWLASFAVLVGLPFIVLNLFTANEFYRRLFPYHDLGRDDRNLERYVGLFWQENAALLIMGGLLILSILVKRSAAGTQQLAGSVPVTIKFSLPEKSSITLSALFLLFSLPLLLGLGVVGTDHNHFLPAEAAGCAAAGVLIGQGLRLPAGNGWRWLTLLPLALLWVQISICAVPAQRYEIEFRPYSAGADYQRQLAQIVANASNQPRPILSSEAAFLVMTARPADHYYYNDLFTLYALSRQGRYDLSGLLEAVKHKEFGLILAEGNFFSGGELRGDTWPPQVIEAIRQNYQVKFRDVWFVYEPKP